MLKQILCIVALAIASFQAMAAETDADAHRAGVGFAVWGMFDDMDKGALQASYEFAEQDKLWGIRPVLLGMVADNSKYYLSVGWLKEFELASQWSWGVGGQAGYFHDPGPLGYEVEFYTRVMVNYQLDKDVFIRGEFGHISNAGFGDANPGSENLTLSINWQL
jgi:hypothetical protein